MTRILIIDDDEGVRGSYRMALEAAGYTVVEAGTGRAGLEAATIGKFDLVITDMLMPDIDGMEIIRALRKKGSEPKIVAISGGGEVTPGMYLKLAEKFGANFCLTKPLSRTDLLSAVSRLAHP